VFAVSLIAVKCGMLMLIHSELVFVFDLGIHIAKIRGVYGLPPTKGGGCVKSLPILLLLLFAVSVLGLTPVALNFPSSEATYTYYEEYFLFFNSSAGFKDLDFVIMNSIDSLLFMGPNYTTTLITPIGVNALTRDRDVRRELEEILDSSTIRVSSGNVMTIKNNHIPSYVWLKYPHNGEEKWLLLSLFLVENGFAEYEECKTLQDPVSDLLIEAQARAEERLAGQGKKLASAREKSDSPQEPRGKSFIYSPAGSSDVYSVDPSKYETLNLLELFAALEGEHIKPKSNTQVSPQIPSYRPEEVIVYVITSELITNKANIRYHEKDCPSLVLMKPSLSQLWLSTALSEGCIPCPICDPPIVDTKSSEVIFDSHTVYITSDLKYHRATCPLLEAKEKTPTRLIIAQSYGYKPCSICNPPK